MLKEVVKTPSNSSVAIKHKNSFALQKVFSLFLMNCQDFLKIDMGKRFHVVSFAELILFQISHAIKVNTKRKPHQKEIFCEKF